MLTPEQTNEGQAPEVVTPAPAPAAAKPAAKAAAKTTSKKVTAKAEPKAKREHDESEGPAPTMVNGAYVGGGDEVEDVLTPKEAARRAVDSAFNNQAQIDALHAVLDLIPDDE